MKNTNYSARERRSDLDDIEYLTWLERRFGPLTKTVGINPTNEAMREIEIQLIDILSKYQNELKITIPLPKIRTWIRGERVNFLFFDRHSNRRILLGDWLSNKITYYEH